MKWTLQLYEVNSSRLCTSLENGCSNVNLPLDVCMHILDLLEFWLCPLQTHYTFLLFLLHISPFPPLQHHNVNEAQHQKELRHDSKVGTIKQKSLMIFMTQDMSDNKPTIFSLAWNSTWILLSLSWGDILSLGPCWAPLIFFHAIFLISSCELVKHMLVQPCLANFMKDFNNHTSLFTSYK